MFSLINLYFNTSTDSTIFSQSSTSLEFTVNERNLSAIQCYNISGDFHTENICELFEGCSELHLQSLLMKANESDPVVLMNERAEVVVQLPSKCRCPNATESPSVSPDGGIDALTVSMTVLTAVVVIAIAAGLVATFFYRRKRNRLEVFRLEE